MDTQDPLRKAVAIVFCDIVGFGRLNATEGDLVATTVLRAFVEQAGRLATEHHCSTIKVIGDCLLTTFGDIQNTMPFIVSIQNLLAQDAVLSEWRLAVTFSLTFGDVLFVETSYGTDVLGDEVNIAAHLNDLAQPHQLVISQAALDRLPPEQQALAGPSETCQLRRGAEVQIHRVSLAAP